MTGETRHALVPILIRWVVVCLLLTLAAGAVYYRLDEPRFGFDDANIFMVYARHLAHGNGLVYNVGGERVEGFTSLLYVIIMAAFYLVTDAPEPWLAAFNIVLTGWVVTALSRLADEGTGRVVSLPGSLVVLWCLVSPPFIMWTCVALMDVTLWMAAVVSLLLALDCSSLPRRRLWVAGTVLAMVLTRPEAMAWVPALLAFWAWRQRRPGAAAAYLGWFAACVAGLTLFRLSYFGYPLPNTYYAKVSPDRWYNLLEGGRYLGGFLWRGGGAAAIVAIAVGCARPRGKSCVVAWAILVGLLIPVLSGGDHFPGFRFYQPIWPLVGVLLAQTAGRMIAESRVRRSVALGAVVLAMAAMWCFALVPKGDLPATREGRNAIQGRAIGAALATTFPPDHLPNVGVYLAGGVKVTYPGRVFDMLGLNHVAMGHSSGDRHGQKNHAAFNLDVFFAEMPDLVMPSVGHARPGSPSAPPERLLRLMTRDLKGLPQHPRFAAHYAWGWVSNPQGQAIFGFYHKQYLQSLADMTVRQQ